MAGEEWARRIVEREFKRIVAINDDGSQPGMYDLRIGLVEAPEVAIECVGAVDPIFAETWNVGLREPIVLSIRGDWNVTIRPGARVKQIRKNIEQILQRLEARGFYHVRVDFRLERQEKALFDEVDSLNITNASCFRIEGSGNVHLGMTGIGGAVDELGRALPRWVGEFLHEPTQQDVVRKLERSRAPERQVFIIVSFAGTPWSVESYLTGALDHLPSHGPDLPPPLTGVWIVSEMGRRGLRWDGGAWHIFDARGNGIDN